MAKMGEWDVPAHADWELKNPFGIRDGRVITIGDLSENEKGLACLCKCPSCNAPFQARMGEKRVWHFSHDSKTDCNEENALKIGAFRFIAEAFLDGTTVSLPPCYLRWNTYQKYKFQLEFSAKLRRGEPFSYEGFENCFELDSNSSNNSDEDAWECYVPLRTFDEMLPPELTKRSEDGTYEAIVDFVGFTFSQFESVKGLDEYTPELGIPTSLIIGGPNLHRTRIELVFNFPACTDGQRMRQTSTVQYDNDDMPCLELQVDTSLFTGQKVTSEKVKRQLLQVGKLRWAKIPDAASVQCIELIKTKYENIYLKRLDVRSQKEYQDLLNEHKFLSDTLKSGKEEIKHYFCNTLITNTETGEFVEF